MADTLRFSFTPTKNDYIKASRTFSLRQASTWVMFFIWGILFLVGSNILGRDTRLGAILPALALPLYIVIVLVINPWIAGQRAGKRGHLREETTWEVNDQKITLTSGRAKTKLEWGTFKKVLESDEFFFFIYSSNKNMFRLLPKRAFESQAQSNTFRALVKSKLPGLL